MTWVESQSASFHARHADEDADGAARVLAQLERARTRLGELFPALPEEVTVVLHRTPAELDFAQPALPAVRRATAPAARRYLAGWITSGEIHTLTPDQLARRATGMPGSRELLALTPSALYAQLTAATCNDALPPPYSPRRMARMRRWAWLAYGAGQYFSGQVPHVRGALARRLRESGRPDFPPVFADAALLGGSVLDLLAREEGERAVVELVCRLHPDGPRAALEAAFRGRSFAHTERAWRSHLGRLAAAESEPDAEVSSRRSR